MIRWYDDTPPEEPRLCPLAHRVDPDRPRKSAPNSILCAGHISQSRTALEELPGRYAELATIAAPTYEQRSGARSAEKPIPYRQYAADLRNGGKYDPDRPEIDGVRLVGIRAALTNWVRIVAEERGLLIPAGEGRDEVELAAEFLRRHHDWAVSQLWADDYATELRDLTEAAWSVLYPSGTRRITCGPCMELIEGERCEGIITAVVRDQADLLPSELSCDVCGQTVTADQWVTYGRRVRGEAVGALLAPGYQRLAKRLAG